MKTETKLIYCENHKHYSIQKKYLLKLRIKPEFNPPKIGNSNENGLIATQEFKTKLYLNEMYYPDIIEMKNNLMNQFCEVIIEEIK